MTTRAPGDPLALLSWLARWSLLSAAVALLAGSASALFLWALDHVTRLRGENPWLLLLLPVGGFAVGWPRSPLSEDSSAVSSPQM